MTDFKIKNGLSVTGAITGSNLSGTNTGDNATNSMYSGLVTNANHTGDATGSTVLTLASTITAGGPIGSTSVVPVITYDAKGRLTAVTTATITPAAIGAQVAGTYVNTVNGNSGTITAAQLLAAVNGLNFTGRQSLYGDPTNANTQATIQGGASRGTIVTPTQNIATDELFALKALAYTGSGWVGGAGVVFVATDTITAGARGTTVRLDAIAAGGSVATSVTWDGTLFKRSGNTIWDASNLTNLNQLTNGPGYATGGGTATGTNTGDQVIPTASVTAPAALGVAAVGVGTTFARADHVHLIPTLATLGAQVAGSYEAPLTFSGGAIRAVNAISLTYGTLVNTVCQGNDARLSDARAASDVSAWAKAGTKPAYTAAEVGAIATGGTAGAVTGFTTTASTSLGLTTANNAIGYVSAISLLSQTDGALYQQIYSASWGHQIYGDYRTGQIAIRGNNSGSWQAWRTVWDSVNLTNLNQLTNGPGYTANVGTVTSVGGTGTVSGLTLSGTVSTTGNLTLGGAITGFLPIATTVDAGSF